MKISKLNLPCRIILYVLTLVIISITLISLAVDFMHPVWEIVCYVFAMLFLCVGTYYLVCDIIYIRKNIIKNTLENNSFANRVTNDFRYRTFIFTVPGATTNVIFAMFNGVVGIIGRSAWFGSMAAYYILLSFMRINAVLQGKRLSKSKKVREEYELRIYYRNSILFLVMAIILAGLVILLLFSDGGKTYPGFTIYAMAAYTFYRIIMSIINMVKTKKEQSPLLMIIRKIGYLDACVSILILQTAMFAAFGTDMSENMIKWMNGMTGTLVFFMIMILGVQGIMYAKKCKHLHFEKGEEINDSYISSR